MNCEAVTLYQALGAKNQIILGNTGKIYVLDETKHTDDGGVLDITIETVPLPEVQQGVPVTQKHRLHAVSWQVLSAPPTQGYVVTVTATDVDNPSNANARTLTQFSQEMFINLALTARQFRLKWTLTTATDFDLLSFGYKYQSVHRPYTTQQ